MFCRKIMATALLFLLFPVLCAGVGAETDKEDILGFLAGEYTVIGKKIDSLETYTGRVVFRLKEGEEVLEMTREIDGRVLVGTAALEPVLGGDARVLRIRFREDGLDYEGTLLFQGDLDNYGRLSGYVYVRGSMPRDPGLEAYFIHHTEDE